MTIRTLVTPSGYRLTVENLPPGFLVIVSDDLLAVGCQGNQYSRTLTELPPGSWVSASNVASDSIIYCVYSSASACVSLGPNCFTNSGQQLSAVLGAYCNPPLGLLSACRTSRVEVLVACQPIRIASGAMI